MRILVDTSVDSGFGIPGSAESLWAERWLQSAGPIPISAATVFERCYGFSRMLESETTSNPWSRRLAHYRGTVAESAIYEVLDWDATAALVAGICSAAKRSDRPRAAPRVGSAGRTRGAVGSSIA